MQDLSTPVPNAQPMRDERPLAEDIDWPFFDPAFAVPLAARLQIRPLLTSAATALWSKHVSATPAERHAMLLPVTHWLHAHSKAAGPNWQLEEQAGAVAAFVRQGLATAAGADVYFVTMREQAWRVRVETFLAHWLAFLSLDDEAPFALDTASGRCVAFGPQGGLFSANKFINRAATADPTFYQGKK